MVANTLANIDLSGFFEITTQEYHKAGLANHVRPVNEEKKPKNPEIIKAAPSPDSPGALSVSKQTCVKEIIKITILKYLITLGRMFDLVTGMLFRSYKYIIKWC